MSSYKSSNRAFTKQNIETTEVELNGAVSFVTTFDLVSGDTVRKFRFAHLNENESFDKDLSFAGFEKATVVSNGIHVTNEGKRIAIVDLADDHLLKILPSVRYSTRRYQYQEEAERRGLIPTTAEKVAQIRSVIDSKAKETVTAVLVDRTLHRRFYNVFTGLQGESHRYYVTISDDGINRCVCPGYHRHKSCKHLRAALAKDAVLFPMAEAA